MPEQPELVDRDQDEVAPSPKSPSSFSGDDTTTVKPTTKKPTGSPTIALHPLKSSPSPEHSSLEPVVDIEHVPVEDDPRQWSILRKNISLGLISMGSMIAGLAASIQNPAVKEMEVDLPATSSQFSWSISTFILVQGLFPLIWTVVSEIKGRRLVYLLSLSLFMIGSIVVALSKNIGLVIGFRIFQAAGYVNSQHHPSLSLTLPSVQAQSSPSMGIYYMAPLLGPSLGPIFGGVLATGFSWRAIFWFLTVVSGIILLSFFLLFRDTFRKERSLIYQSVLKQRMAAAAEAAGSSAAAPTPLPSSKENTEKAGITVSEKDVEKAVETQVVTPVPDIELSLMDVNPIRPIGLVLRRLNNFVILFSSGLIFAYGFMIPYTSARTLSAHYGFEALNIGLVTLSYGVAICVFLFLCGFCSMCAYLITLCKDAPPHSFMTNRWIYSSTLAYIVDANVGRSSTAVATNSAFRGVFAFVATEIAVPMQDGVGDGWTYTILAVIMALSGSLILLVAWKGGEWREKGIASENENTTN
ncbi:hypothetical protein MD484_g5667, partial [Candolleomyces efflorescens]